MTVCRLLAEAPYGKGDLATQAAGFINSFICRVHGDQLLAALSYKYINNVCIDYLHTVINITFSILYVIFRTLV